MWLEQLGKTSWLRESLAEHCSLQEFSLSSRDYNHVQGKVAALSDK